MSGNLLHPAHPNKRLEKKIMNTKIKLITDSHISTTAASQAKLTTKAITNAPSISTETYTQHKHATKRQAKQSRIEESEPSMLR